MKFFNLLRRKLYLLENFYESCINLYKGKGFFPNWHIWDLKYAHCNFIAPRLKEFKRMWENGEMQAYPDWILEKPLNDSYINKSDQLKAIWISYLEDMIFAFEHTGEYFAMSTEEHIRKQRGYELFTKFYEDLWD